MKMRSPISFQLFGRRIDRFPHLRKIKSMPKELMSARPVPVNPLAHGFWEGF
jgi:hypothetical protein